MKDVKVIKKGLRLNCPPTKIEEPLKRKKYNRKKEKIEVKKGMDLLDHI